MDQGGELGHCIDVVCLFESAGYTVEHTAPDSSHQNGPGECPHCTIGDAIHTMLASAGLEPCFWPYAFHHFLYLYNVTPHRSCDTSPYTICSGKLPDLTRLRTFGCQVYVLPPHASRRSKLCSDARTGLFLGYSQSTKNIIFYDIATCQVKTALHVVFDKAMADSDVPSPNAHLLCGQHALSPDVFHVSSGLPFLNVSSTPFTNFLTVDVSFQPSDSLPFALLALIFIMPTSLISCILPTTTLCLVHVVLFLVHMLFWFPITLSSLLKT